MNTFMNRAIEKQMAQRTVELGRSGDGIALLELAELLHKDSVEVRRLAQAKHSRVKSG